MTTQQLVNEIHSPARRNYVRLRTEMRGINDTLQADFVDMVAYSKHNRGYKYILTVINIFSKKAYARPLKNKSGIEVEAALENILDSMGYTVKHIHTDRGKEFYNARVRSMLEKRDIQLYSTFTRMKAAICERFNRTLKSRMWKYFSLRTTKEWLDILPKLIAEYNDTKHRTIKMKPNDVDKYNEEQLLLTIYNNNENSNLSYDAFKKQNKTKFKVGDSVRISKSKHVFEKGYTPNWTTEIFTIRRVRNTYPITYLLRDWRGVDVEGVLYTEELLLAKYPDVYIVEKVLRRKNNQAYVKWLGFDDEFNEWIDEDKLNDNNNNNV